MEKQDSTVVKSLKTNIYIDGYNLYYGCLKGTNYKWLDVESLFFNEILPSIIIPKHALPTDWQGEKLASIKNGERCVKFFTAEISVKIAKSDESLASQRAYHEALKSRPYIELIKGDYSITRDTPFKPHPNGSDRPTDNRERVETLKVEEKKTDVNIALHAYHDAITDENLDQIVIVSNDTDLVPAVEFIKKYSNKIVGLVTPTKDKNIRRTNKDLSRFCDWVRERVDEEELRRSQLERVIKLKRNHAVKPWSWYPNADILEEILSYLMIINNKKSKAIQWLNSKNPIFDGNKPIDLLEDREKAKKILYVVCEEAKKRSL